MQRTPGTKILAENDAHVHPAQGVDRLDDLACIQRSADLLRSLAPAGTSHQDPGHLHQGIGVPEEHDVYPGLAQHAGAGPGQPAPTRTVEHLGLYAPRNRVGVALDAIGRFRQQLEENGSQEGAGGEQED